MIQRSIRVKVVRESANTVTVRLMSVNREMPVRRADFEERVSSGLYEVVGAPVMN